MPRTLYLSITAIDSPVNIKQKIAIPSSIDKNIDIRIYGQRLKYFYNNSLKIFILKVNRIVDYCPIQLISKPKMHLLGRVIFHQQDIDYIPECLYSNYLTFTILKD